MTSRQVKRLKLPNLPAEHQPGRPIQRLTLTAPVLYSVNMARSRHPKKDVEGALQEAESAGWTVVPTKSGHRWGVARCAGDGDDRCRVSIWSTPRNPGDHAKQLRRFVARCPHGRTQEEEQH